MTTYQCKECGAPASVEDQKIIRSCQCNGGIIANLKAKVSGKAVVAGEKK